MYVLEYLQDAIIEYTTNPKRDYLDPEDLPFEKNKGSQPYKEAGIAHDVQAVFAMKQVYTHTYIHLYIHTYIDTYIHTYIHYDA